MFDVRTNRKMVEEAKTIYSSFYCQYFHDLKCPKSCNNLAKIKNPYLFFVTEIIMRSNANLSLTVGVTKYPVVPYAYKQAAIIQRAQLRTDCQGSNNSFIMIP